MMISRRLPKFHRKIDALEDVFSDNEGRVLQSDTYVIERAVMQVQIEWELFVRNLILDSATGNYTRENGDVLKSDFNKITSREAASYKLISLYPKRTTEPDWYLPDQAIVAAKKLKINNFPVISLELGVSPWPINDLRYLRNFIAHRSKSSALKMRNENVVPNFSKIKINEIVYQYSSDGIQLYKLWLNFIRGISNRLVV